MTDLELVKDSISIYSLIEKDVHLRQSSGNPNRYMGLCPFHNEKNPSFCVDDSIGRYRCFGCGANGDAIQWLQDIGGLSFKEAITEAKSIAGIEDRYLTPAQRKLQEVKLKQAAQERQAFKKWRAELRSNLLCYTSLEWEIYRKSMRQLLETYTEEMEAQAETAKLEAERKEAALEEFEAKTDSELLGYYRTRKSWEGKQNPGWFLSGKRLEMVKKANGK